MRTIKIFGWEAAFRERIMVLRGRERAQLWNMQATLGVNRSFAMITTLLVSIREKQIGGSGGLI